jgi:hypothetical protein
MGDQKKVSKKTTSLAPVSRQSVPPLIGKAHRTEVIRSDTVLSNESVEIPERRTHKIKVMAAVSMAAAGIVIGVAFLIAAVVLKDGELRTWSMGLITFVLGSVLGYGFGNSSASES